ncbi:MAG: hypothetical protein K1W05_04830 [Desulfovibrio sp.]
MLAGRAEGLAEGLCAQKTALSEMLSYRFGAIPAGWRDTVNSLAGPDIISIPGAKVRHTFC